MTSEHAKPHPWDWCKINLDISIRYSSWLAFEHFNTHLADSFCLPNCSSVINPPTTIPDYLERLSKSFECDSSVNQPDQQYHFRIWYLWRPPSPCYIFDLRISCLNLSQPFTLVIFCLQHTLKYIWTLLGTVFSLGFSSGVTGTLWLPNVQHLETSQFPLTWPCQCYKRDSKISTKIL